MRICKVICLVMTIFMLVGFSAVYVYAAAPVTVERDLPAHASAGSGMSYSIAVAVDEANKPNGLIIKEYIPSGWTLSSCTPNQNSYNQAAGEIKWLFGVGLPIADTTINCTVNVLNSETEGAVRTFSGELNYNAGGEVTEDIGGDLSVTIGLTSHSCDANQDWTIGDFELLDMIDFWAAGGYCWDDGAASYLPGVPDGAGMCQ